MTRSTWRDLEFTDFTADLEKLRQTHPHVVRREPGVTYTDKYALQQLIDISPELYEQHLKGWSRSYYLKDKHQEAIVQYGLPDIPKSALDQFQLTESVKAIENGLSSLPCVRAYDIMTELDQVSFKSSSAAGYDYVGEKGLINSDNHIRAINRAKRIMWSLREEGEAGFIHAIDTMVPDVGYTRTQLADITEKTKIRNVWGRAFHYILLEGLTAQPLIKAFAEADTFYHVGQDPLDSVPNLLSKVAANSKWLYALDWKQFDATVSRFEIKIAFDILKSKLIFPNEETEMCFELTKQLFIHKKIAAPDGYIYWSHKGIPSGSYFTSIIGSIINRVRIEYLWRTITGHGPKICFTQGDDSLCGDDILVTPEVIGRIANQIGWYFNPAKTEYSTVPEMISFLGRTYLGGLNTRDLKRCLRLLIYPEYPVDSGRISAYRASSIAEDAGHISETLNRIAHRLKRTYGVASEEEVPSYFKRYVM